MTMNWNRLVSSLLAVSYIIAGYVSKGAETAFEAGLLVILPLGCIWFGEAMGGYIGPNWRGNITAASPGLIVCVLGWLLLLLPLIVWIL